MLIEMLWQFFISSKSIILIGIVKSNVLLHLTPKPHIQLHLLAAHDLCVLFNFTPIVCGLSNSYRFRFITFS